MKRKSLNEPTARGAWRQRGATTVVVAVGILVVLGTAGIITLNSARQDLFNSMNYTDQTEALLLAEAALEDSAIHLDQIQDWSTIPLPHDEFVGYQALGHGFYQARLMNNGDDTGTSDTDKALRILAKGYTHNNEVTVTLEGMYRRIAFDQDPLAALTVCGNDIYSSMGGSTMISGFDYYLPPSPCSGSGCNPIRKAAPLTKGGVLYEVAGRTTSLSGSSSLFGTPTEGSGIAALQGDKGFCAMSRLISEFMYRLPTPQRITTWPASSTATYGTPSAPALVYVAAGTTLNITGTAQGAGVLLIDGAVAQTGTFTFSGLVVVGRNARINFGGTANIYGSVVTAGGYPDSPATVGMINGNVKLAYCSDAIHFLHGIIMPGLFYSWREYRGPEEPYPTIGL